MEKPKASTVHHRILLPLLVFDIGGLASYIAKVTVNVTRS